VLLVSGDIARRTGGNLYDRRMERACRRAGMRLRMVAVTSTAQARSELRRLRPRVIVIDSIAITIAAPLIGWIRRELGARVVLLMHMPTDARGTLALLREADRVIAVSSDLARTLARKGAHRSRLSVVPPGCDGIPRVARRTRKRREHTLRVLAVANWSATKGIATLAGAAAQVPEVHLDLVGDPGKGPYREVVRGRIRSGGMGGRVVVRGALDERALARRYAEADVFALPTEREGYGIVFGEALAHGLPVIAADIAPVRAIVGDAGLYVPPRQVRSLAAALRLMTDEWLRRRLARNARVRARTLPRWSASQAAFVALIAHEIRAAVTRS
jgi:glycosyltransferase involved in cell wall biosynthesis